MASFVASSLFYSWALRRSNPSPVKFNPFAEIVGESDDNREWLKVSVTLSNPGDVPIHVRFFSLSFLEGPLESVSDLDWKASTIDNGDNSRQEANRKVILLQGVVTLSRM